MQLNLKRPLIVFDVETTGISVANDRVIELCTIKLIPGGTEETRVQRFNPGIPVPAEVTAIHGITSADLLDKPSFSEKAKELAEYMKGCDFAGFNSNKFDFPLLVEEFLRAGIDFDTENRKFVDIQRIFHTMEQRNLSAAYKFYCNKTMENAHTAEADARATFEILQSQLDRYENLENDIDFLHEFSGQGKNVDLAGRMIYNEKGQEIFNFGKHKGKTVEEILKKEPSYYKWMMDGDFSLDTKRRLTQIKLNSFGKN